MPEPALLDILAEFARLGLISFGGTNYAEMERSLVGEHHWITAATLANGVALGQLMPGPNLLAVTHYGYAAAGWGGAAASTLGFYGPTALLSAAVLLAWQRGSAHPWVRALRDALLPFGGGVILASVWVLGRGSIHTLWGLLIAVLTFALLWKTRVNAAVLVLAAAALGAVLGL